MPASVAVPVSARGCAGPLSWKEREFVALSDPRRSTEAVWIGCAVDGPPARACGRGIEVRHHGSRGAGGTVAMLAAAAQALRSCLRSAAAIMSGKRSGVQAKAGTPRVANRAASARS